MYRWMRTLRIKAGKGAEARQACKEIVDYLNATYPGHAYEGHSEVFGAGDTIHFTATFADLAAREAMTDTLAKDKAYLALAAKGDPTVIDGSMHDTLMRSL